MRFPLARLTLLALPAVAGCGSAPSAPEPLQPVPSPRQLRWHELSYYAFVHFNMNTFTDVEWGEGTEDPDKFAPTELDCRQWARVARDAGMRGIILTAKHHDGFCLWPSEYTEHSVKNSSWRDGKGDVLRDLSQACAEYGLEFGVYLSPWDRNHPAYGDSPRYNQVFQNQLTEVLTGYGDVFEVWFDGACGEGPNGKRQEYDWPAFVGVVREHQPDAVIFSDAGPDVRWVGNERGFAGETNWGMLKRDELYPGTPRYAELTEGHEDGDYWVPAECDVSIRPGWYYHADQDDDVKTLDQLFEIWDASVGRGANLLLNLPVDRRGLVHENDVAALMELRRALDVVYGRDLDEGGIAFASSVRGDDAKYEAERVLDERSNTYWTTDDGVIAASLEVVLPEPTCFDRVMLQEYLQLGQRIRAFDVEVWRRNGWQTVATGTTVGNRRIVTFPTQKSHRIRINVRDARACPALSEFGVYLAPPRVEVDPPAGEFIETTEVTLRASVPTAAIYFTLDGSVPTRSSPRYRGPIRLDRTSTVKAIAILEGKASLLPTQATFERTQLLTPTDAEPAGPEAIAPGPVRYMGREIAETTSASKRAWFLREDRELDEGTSELLRLLAPESGQTVCDLGAGNGFHALRLAQAVGANGRVFAVDLQQKLLEELEQRAAAAGIENIETVLSTPVDPRLAPGSCDLVVLVDVYHELSHPAEMLAAVRAALKPGGRLAIVEFREDEELPPLHRMTKTQIRKEITANGFDVAEEFDGLPRQHLMIFVRDDA